MVRLLSETDISSLHSIYCEAIRLLPSETVIEITAAQEHLSRTCARGLMREFDQGARSYFTKWRAAGVDVAAVCKALICVSVLAIEKTILARGIPEILLWRYPSAVGKLLSYLQISAYTDFSDQYFIKDLRLASGLSVPCAARSIDIYSRLGNRAAIQLVLRNPLELFRLNNPVLRFYLDPRYTEEFSETGLISTIFDAEQLFFRDPSCRALVSKSWYNDPAMAEVSPHLLYNSRIPLSGGAILIPGKPSSKDVERATKTSRTRRRLFEEGKYLPAAYTIIWQRSDLLDWVKRNRRLGEGISANA
jgi:hypothetical protein